jgi:hypothetical protein
MDMVRELREDPYIDEGGDVGERLSNQRRRHPVDGDRVLSIGGWSMRRDWLIGLARRPWPVRLVAALLVARLPSAPDRPWPGLGALDGLS